MCGFPFSRKNWLTSSSVTISDPRSFYFLFPMVSLSHTETSVRGVIETRCSQTIQPTHFCPSRPLASSDASPIHTAIDLTRLKKLIHPSRPVRSHTPRTTSIPRASSSASPTSGHRNSSQPKPGPRPVLHIHSLRCPRRTNLVNAVFADPAFHNVKSRNAPTFFEWSAPSGPPLC